MYFVLENDGQNKTPTKVVIPVDKDAPPVPEYNLVDDVPASSPAPPPVPAASPAPLETLPPAQLSLKQCMLR